MVAHGIIRSTMSTNESLLSKKRLNFEKTPPTPWRANEEGLISKLFGSITQVTKK